jgi:hypothetical protein
MAFVLPSADSPWAAADHALADIFSAWAEVDRYGPGAAPLSALASASAVRQGYDAVVLSVAAHHGHFHALQWLLQCHQEATRVVIAIGRDRSLAGYYRSLGDQGFAAAWHAHYPKTPVPATPQPPPEALMLRAAVAHCDWFILGDHHSVSRAALDVPPALAGRLVAPIAR